jgi:NADPH-dependent glutamate synthase beta subunit-like oxidoreductase
MIRSQIPRFRLPETVIDEEVGYITGIGGMELRLGQRIDSLKALLGEGFDAIFVGSGAPRGRELDIPGRQEAAANIHIGIDWLSSVSFGHVTRIGKRVIVLGGGNTAMDCCRTSRRLGGEEVKVIVRSGFEEMKASPWEKEDAMHEDIPILNMLVPKEFRHDNGRLIGMTFEKVKAEYDDKGRRRLVPTGEPEQFFECDARCGRRASAGTAPRSMHWPRTRHGVRPKAAPTFSGASPGSATSTPRNSRSSLTKLPRRSAPRSSAPRDFSMPH